MPSTLKTYGLTPDDPHTDYSSVNNTDALTGDKQKSNPELSPLDDNEESKLLPAREECALYTRRWYILFLFSMMSATQALNWNTWAPVSNSVKVAFGWNDGDISLFANWGPIMFLAFMPVFAWMVDTKGLRWAVVTGMFCVAVGAGIRCIPITHASVGQKWMMHAGQILNGIGGPVGSGAMPAVSAQWFPPHERATATALPMVAKFVALSTSFIFGPLLVPDVNATQSEKTTRNIPDDDFQLSVNASNGTGVNREELQEDITLYLRIEAGLACGVLVLILVYFPGKPPSPPCVSASVERESFVQGLLLLIRNFKFWLMALVSLLVGGFNTAWISVLSINLMPIGATQQEAGWIGFYSGIAACISMLVIARLGDYFARYMKWYISAMYFVAASMYLWFALICLKLLPNSTVYLYIALIVGQTSMNATNPLFYELSCDMAYPVGEGTSSGVLTMANQLSAIVFLLIMMIPNIGTMWLNWGMLGAMITASVLVLLVKEKHNRLDLDISQPDKTTVD